jgi:heme oxygenase
MGDEQRIKRQARRRAPALPQEEAMTRRLSKAERRFRAARRIVVELTGESRKTLIERVIRIMEEEKK